MSTSDKAAAADVIGYHERTKHHFDRYARSPGYMDWANQPEPFRTYRAVPAIELPFLKTDPATPHAGLYDASGTSRRPFDLKSIAGLLELSMGLSAWKAAGQSRWALRINPSSGNLHPTECHLILPPLSGEAAGVYHYNVLEHALEKRAGLAEDLWNQVSQSFGPQGFFVGLSSIFWRESWKYGERALRYCNHDVGHALAAIRMAANVFGWKAKWLNAAPDHQIETFLGIDRTDYPPLEEEHPDLLCWVWAGDAENCPLDLPGNLVKAFAKVKFQGQPNRLSPKRVDWQIIGRTARKIRKADTAALDATSFSRPPIKVGNLAVSAAELIRRRRSATAFSDSGKLTVQEFQGILTRTLPDPSRSPFDVGPVPGSASLIIFAHSITGLPAGLYVFIRSGRNLKPLQESCLESFQWSRPIAGFPLYLLEEGNFRQTATMLSCHQSIAGEGVFSLGMLARFRGNLEAAPHRYRLLFWEAGMIGQILYLEAEAYGLRGTGIGCYFDDEVHSLLGLSDNTYQSLYHFTVGLPLEDQRLTTLPPYGHLRRHGA